jgi:hypothetical protein
MRDSRDCEFDILIQVCGKDRDEALLSELISALEAGFDHFVGTHKQPVTAPELDSLLLTGPSP